MFGSNNVLLGRSTKNSMQSPLSCQAQCIKVKAWSSMSNSFGPRPNWLISKRHKSLHSMPRYIHSQISTQSNFLQSVQLTTSINTSSIHSSYGQTHVFASASTHNTSLTSASEGLSSEHPRGQFTVVWLCRKLLPSQAWINSSSSSHEERFKPFGPLFSNRNNLAPSVGRAIKTSQSSYFLDQKWERAKVRSLERHHHHRR